MSVTLRFSEIEADFITQAVEHELDMALIMSGDPFLTAEQQRNIGFKIENLQVIMQKLVES